MGWFFGFKLHMVINNKGEVVKITAGNSDTMTAGGKHILLAHFERPGGERLMNLSLKQLSLSRTQD